jgi:poly-beta-hydroxyalkanoate depolymerase
MPEVIEAAERFCPGRKPDPFLLTLAALPRTAGLATRVRTMIESGASDAILDVYIQSWIESVMMASGDGTGGPR